MLIGDEPRRGPQFDREHPEKPVDPDRVEHETPAIMHATSVAAAL